MVLINKILILWLFSRTSNSTVKLQIVVTAMEFDPLTLFITNQLTPMAINLFPVPQQNLWLYNPYSTDIKLRLISGHARLVLVDDEIVVKSHQHFPLILKFAPFHVGIYEVWL